MRDPYEFANHEQAPKAVLNTIKTILQSWDMPKTDYRYASVFKSDGVLHVLSDPAKGEAEIKQLHDSMINPETGPVVDLQHRLDRIWVMPAGHSAKTEVIYTGTLESVLLDGQVIVTDYATFLIMSEGEADRDVLQVEYLRVFSDTSKLSTAIEKILSKGQGTDTTAN